MARGLRLEVDRVLRLVGWLGLEVDRALRARRVGIRSINREGFVRKVRRPRL